MFAAIAGKGISIKKGQARLEFGTVFNILIKSANWGIGLKDFERSMRPKNGFGGGDDGMLPLFPFKSIS